jgi:hypothetical protein
VLSFVVGIFPRPLGIPPSLEPPLLLGLFALGVVLFFVPSLPRWRCPACGHQWAQAEPEEEVEEDEEDDAKTD